MVKIQSSAPGQYSAVVDIHVATERLHTLEAVVTALERRDDVIALIAASEDPASARAALATLLGTDENAAQAVLTLHWSAITQTRHQQAIEDLEDIRRAVTQLRRQQ